MRPTYCYVCHFYEGVRQRCPTKHKFGRTTVLTDGAGALGRSEELAKEFS